VSRRENHHQNQDAAKSWTGKPKKTCKTWFPTNHMTKDFRLVGVWCKNPRSLARSQEFLFLEISGQPDLCNSNGNPKADQWTHYKMQNFQQNKQQT